jgi:hypothetical protein
VRRTNVYINLVSSVSGQADARLLANQLPRAVSLATPRLPDALTLSMPSLARFATVTLATRTLVSRGDIHTPRCFKRVPFVKQAIRTARSAAESEAVGARVSSGARDRIDTDDTSSLRERAPGITAGSTSIKYFVLSRRADEPFRAHRQVIEKLQPAGGEVHRRHLLCQFVVGEALGPVPPASAGNGGFNDQFVQQQPDRRMSAWGHARW